MGWLLVVALALTFVTLMGALAQPQAGLPQSTPSPIPGLPGGGMGGIKRTFGGWREWRRADPTLINSLLRSRMGNGIRKQLGNAEVYIILALLIGVVTVVIGCWLSDNCWSPEPDTGGVSLA
ncbi:uncharacterized protein LOC132699179 isoform X2 [Cylas formicarius]|uniref:uncharacterized protein LOC132699179 isoform X2 n=1 Tax=Cylas formicarius TaxID=197179 RepID=UPI00295869ED|nr:uncharacterized protein LOC132699179 isoform X2 [Cylas formicarius]